MARLVDPLNQGRIALANRLVMPPMATQKADESGRVSQAILDYYDDKSHGGMGLIIIEHSYIEPAGRLRDAQPSVADEDTVPGLARLADVIHANGPKAVLQMNHSGAACRSSITGSKPVAPSAVPLGPDGEMPHELTEDEIAGIVASFARAAGRAKRAGFDGVEIHSAHMYLLNEFYSPLTNRRTDGYGGSLEGRIRIHLEVIAAVRAEVGPDYPVYLRLGASDYTDGGSTIDDAVEACVAFARAGVDVIDISGGARGYMRPDGYPEQGYFSDVTSAVRRAAGVPVILTGGITDATVADRLLEEGAADLIGVGRPILKDSRWATRALAEPTAAQDQEGERRCPS